MTGQVRNILDSFDMLPEADKRELAVEIIRRSLELNLPPLTDDELVGAAEETFLELDRPNSRPHWISQNGVGRAAT
jgi:hypothetical protein